MGAAIKPPPGAQLKDPVLAGAPNTPVNGELVLQDKDKAYPPDLSQIADRLGTKAQQQVTLKLPVEQRWLRAVRAYHGKYAADFLKALEDAKQSTAFVKLTRAKTVALEARLFDLMFPTDDRNWSISSTPVPKLTDEKREAELRATSAAAQANEAEGQGQDSTAIVAAGQDEAARAEAVSNTIAEATRAAKLMQDLMDDQLIESSYPSEFRRGIHDFCLLGTMVLKGPIRNEKTRGRWMPLNRPTASGDPTAQPHEYELKQTADFSPMIRRVNPWNYFPDMSGSCVEEAEFHFERYLWTPTDLRRMVKTHGFDPNAVRELLRDDVQKSKRPDTSPSLINLVQLRSLTDDVTTGQITGRYVGWEYHGPLECDEVCLLLRAMGQDALATQYEQNEDPLQELRVVVHFCENVVLKISPEWPLDSGEALYSVANLEDAEGQMFGYGIPTIMEDDQVALNSSWRMALDNGALSVGPQALITKDEIQPQDGVWRFSPRKMWLRVKAAVPHAPQSIQFFDVPNNMEEIAMLIKLATEFIDMVTGIPQPQAGEEARSTPTVGGMAILQSNANIIFRRIVKSLDDGIITPTMRRLYDFNMQFSDNPDVKGDMQVDARGTSVLLVKEVQAQNLMIVVNQLLANPNIAPMIQPYPAVEKLFQSMMIKPSEVMVDETDYQKYLAQIAQQPPEASPQEIAAKAKIQEAQIKAAVAGRQMQSDYIIEELKQRVAALSLAAKGDINAAQLQAMLEGKQMDIDAAERKLVAEAAIDQQNAAQAYAHGEVPGGSGGDFNAGAAKPHAAA